MPKSVRLLNDPILRTRCIPVDAVIMSGVPTLLEAMFETMKAEGGIGLAANQIGHPVRVFILKDNDGYREFINPEVVTQNNLVEFQGEACLSIPGASATTQRYQNITLTWLDKNGTKIEESFGDLKAFAVQHEMDHLDGKLYVDQFGPVKRSLIVGKHKKYLKSSRRK